jgi:hypothetical protein
LSQVKAREVVRKSNVTSCGRVETALKVVPDHSREDRGAGEAQVSLARRGGLALGKRVRRVGQKSANLALRRVGDDIAGREGVQIACNTKFARLGDGRRWFERGPGDFSDARALHRIALMMGSGEDKRTTLAVTAGAVLMGRPTVNFSTPPAKTEDRASGKEPHAEIT